MRKVFMNITVQLTIEMDDDVSMKEILDNIEYDFWTNDDMNKAFITDMEYMDYEITDSK